MHNILIVDDEPDICELLEDILQDEGYQTQSANNGQQAQDKFYHNEYSLILMDIWMPDIDGISLLSEFVKSDQKTPAIIMMSGHGTVETAVESTRLGAYDFLEKPLSTAKLLLTVKNALSHVMLEAENVRLKTDQKTKKVLMVGKSPIIEALKQTLSNMSNHTSPVLINGESGVGKSLLAESIHQGGPNKDGPFIKIAAASILTSNMEHELFGTELSGEVHQGLLEQAATGTLYIKQIENMELGAQSVLAGVLKAGQYKRVGGLDNIKMNARIIASTSVDLQKSIREGDFSEDLYYYLNVLNVTVPPLVEHRDDISDLSVFFTKEFTEVDGLAYRHFSVAAQNFMRQHDWFGNVIELKNLVQRLLINGGEEEISLAEVQDNLGSESAVKTGVMADDELYGLSLKAARDAFERGYLLHHLQKTGGNISQTAQLISVERANLYRKLRVHKIDPRNL